MPRLAPVVALALAAAAQPPAPLVGDASVVEGALGRRLDAHVARLAPFGFAGSVLVVRAGRPVLAKGYGLADRARGTPVTARSIIPLGSIVKSFTAAAVLALEADGRLRTTDSLARFFPDLPADKRAITVAQLLAHGAGLPLYPADDDRAPMSRAAFMRAWRDAPLAYPPGTGRAYSNVGYGVLAAIVEDLSGRDLEAFVRERLLTPAGLRETGWHYPAWDTTRVARAYAGARGGAGMTQLRLPRAEGARLTWAVHGAGGWLSTPEDLYRWHVALSGDALLPAAQRAKLLGGATRPPAAPAPVASPLGARAMVIAGGDGTFETVLARYAEPRTVVVVAATSGGEIAGPIADALDRIAAGSTEPPAPPAVIALPAAALARHAGTYALPSGGAVAVAATERGVALAPAGQDAFDAVFGAPAGSAERRAALAARTDSVVRASLAGDWAPFRAALGLEAPLDTVARREERRRATITAGLGARTGWRVVGVMAHPAGGDVVVRFDHERGALHERYGWRGPGVELFLQGRESPSLTLLPTDADAFAWYDLGRGSLVTARFAGDRLRLETGGGSVEAVRTGGRARGPAQKV